MKVVVEGVVTRYKSVRSEMLGAINLYWVKAKTGKKWGLALPFQNGSMNALDIYQDYSIKATVDDEVRLWTEVDADPSVISADSRIVEVNAKVTKFYLVTKYQIMRKK